MALTITLYSFAKRKNSTKRPDGLTGEALQVVLKHPTSYISPAFLLQRAGGFPFNYVEWDGWYYFIDDIVSTGNDRFEVRCSLDVLATLKTYIQATSAFVLYDETANSELPDSRLSVQTSKSVAAASGQFRALGGHSFPGGTIVAGIVTDDGVSFYAMDGTTADTLLEHINQNEIPNLLPIPTISWVHSTVEEILDGIAEIIDTIGKNMVTGLRHILGSKSASECIVSAKQLPVAIGSIEGSSGTIYLGMWNSSKSGKRITNRMVLDSCDVAIPWTFTDWRRNNPYTELYLYIPYVGLVSLSPGDLMGASSLHIDASLDVISGDVLFEVRAGTGQLGESQYIGQYSGNIAGTYAIGSSAVPYGQQVVMAIGATAAGAAIASTGGAAAAMVAGFAGIMATNTPTPTTIGGGGGGAALGLSATCYCFAITHDTNVAPDSVASVIGTPAMASKQLGALSGFIQTKNAEVSAPFPGPVLAECNSLLDGGFFLE